MLLLSIIFQHISARLVMDKKPVLCQRISSLNAETRFLKKSALHDKINLLHNLYPKTFCLTSSVLKKWKALTGAGTAVTSTEASLSSISVSEFLILFWQSRSETDWRGFCPRHCVQMLKMLFLCPDCAPQLIFVYGCRWLLRWLSVERIWLLCSLSSSIKKHHLPPLFTADLYSVSHMHSSKLSLLSL